MAYEGEVKGTATQVYIESSKLLSKKLNKFPADSLTGAEEQIADQVAYWPIYLCIYSSLQTIPDPLVSLFTKFVPDVYLRKGFLHQELGGIFTPLIMKPSDIPEPGKDLLYKMYAYPRIRQEHCIGTDLHLVAPYNSSEFQHAGKFIDVETYNNARSMTVEFLTQAIRNTLEIIVKSILLAGTPPAAFERGLLAYVWDEDLQTEDSFSKQVKEFLKKDGEFIKSLKELCGKFKDNLKNIFYFEPQYASLADVTWKNIISPPKALATSVDSADKLKELFQEVYINKTDTKEGNRTIENKNNPKTGLTRHICIYSLINLMEITVYNMTSLQTVENSMTYDPYAASQPTDLQDMYRIQGQDLIILMNKEDYFSCKQGVAFTGSGGTVMHKGLENIESQVKLITPLEGMLPGQVLIIDHRFLNIFPYFEELLTNENNYYLVKQFYLHWLGRIAIFRHMVGRKLVATRWIAGSEFMNKYTEKYKAV